MLYESARKSPQLELMQPILVDLFCGAGGLSLGARLAGFKIGAALDIDPNVCGTYAANFQDTPVICADIRELSGSDILRAIPEHRVDVLAAGPCCQGFSTHGKRDRQDPRNFLFKEFIRIVRSIQPPWVLMENVKGLLTYDRGWYRDTISDSLKRAGYRVEVRLLNAADYGVPQRRERIVFLATNTNRQIDFPSPSHCSPNESSILGLQNYVTVGEALGDLPALGASGSSQHYAGPPTNAYQRYCRNENKHLTLHSARSVSEYAMSIIRRIPEGKGLRFLPPETLPERFHRMRRISTGAFRRDCTTLYYRLSPEQPAYTITCYFTNVSSGPFVHPSANRALTAREAARLQSFPDSYVFRPPKINHQIGNAIPPLLGRAVAGVLFDKLKASFTSLPAAS
jgi:DNA (cytosine-5)-methyltransferase 1